MKKIIFLLPFFLFACGPSALEEQKNKEADPIVSSVDTVKQADPSTEQAIQEAEKRVNEKEKRETN